MTINALEEALWQTYMKPEATQGYHTDARAFLNHFRLDENERSMLEAFDIMAMISHGANPLLVMMAFQTIKGTERMPEYFVTVNQINGETPSEQ